MYCTLNDGECVDEMRGFDGWALRSPAWKKEINGKMLHLLRIHIDMTKTQEAWNCIQILNNIIFHWFQYHIRYQNN